MKEVRRMDREGFVKSIKESVRDSSVSGTVKNLEKPAGRQPDPALARLSAWYTALGASDKRMVRGVIERAVDQAVFGFLAVLDGVRVIEDRSIEGRLELRYTAGSSTVLLNNEDDEYLHDIYNDLTKAGQ
jgi:hypothetical protein